MTEGAPQSPNQPGDAECASSLEPQCSTGSFIGSGPRRVTFSDAHTYHQIQASSSAGDVSYHEAEPPPGCWQQFKLQVKLLKRDVLALYYAVHDPRTPWISRLLPWLVLAYALSPLDLIPDFIPVLGLVDDLLLLPLGLWLSFRLIPAQVMQDCRQRASHEPLLLQRNWLAALLVFCLWLAALLLLVHWLVQQYGDEELREYEWAALAGSAGVAAILFAAWLVSRIRYEARKRDEWNAALLNADHLAAAAAESAQSAAAAESAQLAESAAGAAESDALV